MAEAIFTRAENSAEAVTPAEDAKKVNILVVDDLPEKLVIYQTILEELNQNIVFARSGEEALRQVLKHEFAVILLDVNMPGMDGFEVASMIRERRKSARTPIIFLTAFTDDVQVAQGYASGAVDYLPTPVVPEVLKAKVRVFIELSQMREQAAAQAEEYARRTAAEESERRKDEFLGMLAHELRNPLGPIRNAVYLMNMLGPEDPRWNDLRDMIGRQVSHMSRLIDDLLDSTRLSRGQILLRKERCDLCRIVKQTADDYRCTFEASGIDLAVSTPSKPIWMEGDPTRLVQALGNLLHNAHKFSNAGGSVKVTLKYNKELRQAEISVKDKGLGIEPAILPDIFDMFRQADQGLDRSRGGLGLGLSLVKGLIELHGGRVSAASAGPGKGATFVVGLPVRIAATPDEEADSPAPSPPEKSCRVLVVEDNPDTAASAGLLLRMDGYEVRIAHTGPEGLEAAREFRPQIVLCDIGLPGMDGYQVARALRDDENLSSAHIIALTGYGREEDLRKAKEAGFDLHLVKPIDHDGLRRALGRLSL